MFVYKFASVYIYIQLYSESLDILSMRSSVSGTVRISHEFDEGLTKVVLKNVTLAPQGLQSDEKL